MSKKSVVSIAGAVCLAIAVVLIPIAYGSSEHSGHGKKSGMDTEKHAKTEKLSLAKIHSQHLPMALHFIDKATAAVEAGNKKEALAELQKIKKLIAEIKKGIGEHVKPQFANTVCPIMGSTINPDKITKNLVRDYKGQKIALCCGGCPAQWDRLTDAEKDAKLARAKPKPVENHSGHKH